MVIDLPVHSRSAALPRAPGRNACRVARQVPPLVDRFAGFGAPGSRRPWAARGTKLAWWSTSGARRTGADLRRPARARCWICTTSNPCCTSGARQAESGAAGFAHRIFAETSRELERPGCRVFAGAGDFAERCRRGARASRPGARVRSIRTPFRRSASRRGRMKKRSSSRATWSTIPTSRRVRFFRREVWPRLRERWPRLVWRLVGKNPARSPGKARRPANRSQGPVEDAVSELARASVAVVPLLAGSGTRLKILEAWAGAAGGFHHRRRRRPAGRDGENLLLAEGGAAFASAVSRLLARPQDRQGLGMAGRLLLEKRYTWEVAWRTIDF